MGDLDAEKLRFTDCELDLAARELRLGGSLQAVEPRVFELLAFLVRERHRAVTKDEIQDVVWRGSIVSETALTRAIMKARRAVGDSADTQTVIRTVHGHGYQFVATLTDRAEIDTPSADALSQAPAARHGYRLAAAGAIAVLVGVIAFALRPVAVDPNELRIAVAPVANLTGEPDLDWVALGLMGFANQQLTDANALPTVASAAVLQRIDSAEVAIDAAEVLWTAVRRGTDASHVLVTELRRNAGTLRLSYALHGADGTVMTGSMVDAEPVALMRGAIGSLTRELGRTPAAVSVVSEDPFINEAYSRATGLALSGECADAMPLLDIVLAEAATNHRARLTQARCARELGQSEDAERRYQDVIAQTTLPSDAATRADALRGLASVYIVIGRLDDAATVLTDALEAASLAGDPTVIGRVWIESGILSYRRRDFETARDHQARARLAFLESDDGVVIAEVFAAIANIDMAEGELDSADEQLRLALAEYREIGDRAGEARILNNLGYLRRLQGRFDDALPFHQASLDIRRDIGDRVGTGRVLGMLSILYGSQGEHQKAIAAASEAYEIAAGANDKLFMATGLSQLARAQRQAGDLPAARAAFEQAQDIFIEIEDTSRAAQVGMRLARIEWSAGDTNAAERRLIAVRDLAARDGLSQPYIETTEMVGDLAFSEDQPAEAITAFEEALAHIEQSGFIAGRERILTKLGQALLATGDLTAMQSVVGQLQEHEYVSAGSLRVQAEFAAMRGMHARAVATLQQLRESHPDDWRESDDAQLQAYSAEVVR